MSPYRYLLVCAIAFFVLLPGSANLAKAESMPTDCDYQQVVLLFGAKASVIDSTVVCYLRNSTSGLPYDDSYNLVRNSATWVDQSVLMVDSVETINMRDVAKAIINYYETYVLPRS